MPFPAPAVRTAPPVMSLASPAVVSSAPSQPSPADVPLEIHISDGNGSYTSVTLTKTEKGFLGPQGELYTDYPTADQLRNRYVKK